MCVCAHVYVLYVGYYTGKLRINERSEIMFSSTRRFFFQITIMHSIFSYSEAALGNCILIPLQNF